MLRCARNLALARHGRFAVTSCKSTYAVRWRMYEHIVEGRRCASQHVLGSSKAVQQYLSAELASKGRKPADQEGLLQLSNCLQHLTSTVPTLVDDRCIAQLFRAAVLRRQPLDENDVKSLQTVLANLSGAKPPKQLTALASTAHSVLALFHARYVNHVAASGLLRPVLKAATALQRTSPGSPLPLRATSTLLLASSTCRVPAPQLWAALIPVLPSVPAISDLKPLCNALHAATLAGQRSSNSTVFDAAYIALVHASAAAVHSVPIDSWPLHSLVAMAASLLRPPRGHAVSSIAVGAAAKLLHAAAERQQEASPALLTRAATAECRLVCSGAAAASQSGARPLLAAAAAAAAAPATPQREAAHLAAVLLHEGAQSTSADDVSCAVAALQPLWLQLPHLLPSMSSRDLPLSVQGLHHLRFLGGPEDEVRTVAAAAVASMPHAQPALSSTSVLFCVRALARAAPLASLTPLAQALQRAQSAVGENATTSQQLLLLHCASVLGLDPDSCPWVGKLGDALARGVREQNKSAEQAAPRGVSGTELLVAAEGLLAGQQQRAAARLMRAAAAGSAAPLGAKLLPPPKAPMHVQSAEMLAHAIGALAASLPSDARLMAACTARGLQAVAGGGGSTPPSQGEARAVADALSPRAIGDLVLGMSVTGTLAGRLRVSAHATTQPVAQAILARWLQLQHTAAVADATRSTLQEALRPSTFHAGVHDWSGMACSFLDSMGLFQQPGGGSKAEEQQGGQQRLFGAHSVATGDVLPVCIPGAKIGVFFLGKEDCAVPAGVQGSLVHRAQEKLLHGEQWSHKQQAGWLQSKLGELGGEGTLRLQRSLQLALDSYDGTSGGVQPALAFLQDAAPAHPRAVARLAALHAQGWTLLPLSCWEVGAAANAGEVGSLVRDMLKELQVTTQLGVWGAM